MGLCNQVSPNTGVLQIIILPNPTFLVRFRGNISNRRDSVSSEYPNAEKKVENTTRSGVFLTKFEALHNR